MWVVIKCPFKFSPVLRIGHSCLAPQEGYQIVWRGIRSVLASRGAFPVKACRPWLVFAFITTEKLALEKG